VRRAIRSRRLREQFFPAPLIEDPGWDMLLDLFAAELEDRGVSVSSLCIAAAVAPTTALRWIGKMTEAGLFERRPDPFDRRRAFMMLTEPARQGMHRYCQAAHDAGLAIA
jgi:DNA-binding MarR family transcriptional regulator